MGIKYPYNEGIILASLIDEIKVRPRHKRNSKKLKMIFFNYTFRIIDKV